jgi:hypothetical protein
MSIGRPKTGPPLEPVPDPTVAVVGVVAEGHHRAGESGHPDKRL